MKIMNQHEMEIARLTCNLGMDSSPDEQCKREGHRTVSDGGLSLRFNILGNNNIPKPNLVTGDRIYFDVSFGNTLSTYALCFRCGRIVHESGEKL